MKNKGTISVLVILTAVFSVIASGTGIFYTSGPGEFTHTSVRGQEVIIYGQGVYRHMSADVAIQGIAQDYVTLFLGVPLLLISLFLSFNNSLKGRYLLAGTLFYFHVTYLFYLVMGTYNELFLIYVILCGLSFFALGITLLSFEPAKLKDRFAQGLPVKLTGGFLIFNSIAIGLLWLSVVVPPLFDGTVIPDSVRHYTTLIVQGLDLAILLPLSFVSGVHFIRKKPIGYLLAPVYFVFLSLLMLALISKIIFMSMNGVPAGPSMVVIPITAFVSILCAALILRRIK
jgi:hypothetical protein